MDYCYEKNEGNDTIFTREIKPLISGVFDGRNATIIANGAKGSGKTHVIQVGFQSSLFDFFMYMYDKYLPIELFYCEGF